MANMDAAHHDVAVLKTQAASPATTTRQVNINAHDNNKNHKKRRKDLLWIQTKIEHARLSTCAKVDNTDLRSSA
jgi:hypothetical protein